MALLYVDENEKSLDSELANGTVEEGQIVTREAGGGVHRTDPATDTRMDGIVPHLKGGDHIAEHDEDFRTSLDAFTYDGDGTVAGDSDDVPIAVKEENAIFRPLTIVNNGTDGAPSISANDDVGLAKLSDGTIGVVQAGYTDSQATPVTYGNGGGGDFLPLGYADLAHNEVVNDFDERVRLRVSRDA